MRLCPTLYSFVRKAFLSRKGLDPGDLKDKDSTHTALQHVCEWQVPLRPQPSPVIPIIKRLGVELCGTPELDGLAFGCVLGRGLGGGSRSEVVEGAPPVVARRTLALPPCLCAARRLHSVGHVTNAVFLSKLHPRGSLQAACSTCSYNHT